MNEKCESFNYKYWMRSCLNEGRTAGGGQNVSGVISKIGRFHTKQMTNEPDSFGLAANKLKLLADSSILIIPTR